MKRFRRWMFNGLTALSLLLCVATVLFWVRSYANTGAEALAARHYVPSSYDKTILTLDRSLILSLHRGQAELSYVQSFHEIGAAFDDTIHSPHPGWQLAHEYFGYFPVSAAKSSRGFYKQEGTDIPLGMSNIIMDRWFAYGWPLWLPTLVFALLPATRLMRRCQKRKQPKSGRCRRCGYDLRAIPDRCPECGMIPEKRP